MTSYQPSKQLLNGLYKYNRDNGFNETSWKYCGGDDAEHMRYWDLLFGKDKEKPEKKQKCICGHHIIKNCYITNGNDILVIGSGCIKNFNNGKKRCCVVCNELFKGRIHTNCSKCRKEIRRTKRKMKKVLKEFVETNILLRLERDLIILYDNILNEW